VLKIVLLLKLKSLKAQLEYPTNFALEILSIALIGLIGIPSMLILTNAFPSIGGWGFWELGFMVSLLLMAKGVHHGLFFSFFNHHSLVKNGDLDLLLVRPVHPILQILASSLNLSSIGELLPGLVLFAITCPQVRVAWNLLNVTFLVLVVLSGAIIEWAIYLLFATFDFWLGGESNLHYIPSAFLHSATYYPAHIYGRALRFLITFVFPYAFMAYYPTLYFFQMDVEVFPAFFMYMTPVVAVVSLAIALGFWSVGLRHYQSTGT
jgi:ABC-2 type transport system permease protein